MSDPNVALAPKSPGVAFHALGLVAPVLGGGTPSSDGVNWGGDVPFVTPPDLNGLDGAPVDKWERTLTEEGARSGSTTLESGVLISCRAPVGHVGRTQAPVAFNQGCKGLHVQDEVSGKYLAYCLVAGREALNALANGTTFTELSARSLAGFKVPWPVAAERRRITDYLDRETAEIGAMEAELDQLVQRLESRRSHTVGAQLSTLSTHTTAALQYLADITVGIVIEPSKLYVPEGEGVPALRGLNVRDGHIAVNDLVHISTQGHFDNAKSALRTGDLVTVRTGQVGVSAVVPPAFDGANAIDLVITRPRGGLDSKFLYWFLHSPAMAAAMDNEKVGAVQSHLNVGAMKRLQVPVIPLNEQLQVVGRLDSASSRIDAMVADANRLKTLLVERRQTLIADVVTGRKEIPAS